MKIKNILQKSIIVSIIVLMIGLCVSSNADAKIASEQTVTFQETMNYKNILGVNSGLVAQWRLNERSGIVAKEIINEFEGNVNGGEWTQGKIGNGLDFDGNDDYVNLPQDAIDTIGSLSQGSISLWFKYNYNLDEQEILPLLYIGTDSEEEPDNMLVIEIGHDNPSDRKLYITWVIDDMCVHCFDTGFNLEENTWYHFVAVVGPEGNTGYLNGEELVDRHYNFGGPEDQLFFSDIPVQDIFTIGYGKTASFKSPHFLNYDGVIDDVRIYDKPLSAEEVHDLYNDIEEISISIRGGIGCTINIENRDENKITYNYDLTATGLLRTITDAGQDLELLAGQSQLVKTRIPGMIMSISATVEAEGVLLERSGYVIFGFVLFTK